MISYVLLYLIYFTLFNIFGMVPLGRMPVFAKVSNTYRRRVSCLRSNPACIVVGGLVLVKTCGEPVRASTDLHLFNVLKTSSCGNHMIAALFIHSHSANGSPYGDTSSPPHCDGETLP